MHIKKILITALTISMITSVCYYSMSISAEEFEGKEDKYMALCSSGNLSNGNKTTCENFNKYLKNKNSKLTQELAKQKENASTTKATIESIQKQLDTINKQIAAKEAEINYLTTTITNLQANIEKNNQILKDRMYVMQSYTNENTYINFIFGAKNFSDMFSRIEGFNELTETDQELVKELNRQRKEVEEQQKFLEEAKTTLLIQQEEQKSLKTKYTALLNEQNKSIAYMQDEIFDYGEMTAQLDEAIKKFNEEAAKEPDVPARPPEPPKPSKPDNGNNNNNNNGSNDNTDNNNGSTGNDNENNNSGNSGNENTPSDLGERIYAEAYKKLGCRYWWGKQGPDYFDCSGLVYWSLNKAGYKVGRDTADGYSRRWTGVSFSNSKTGDLVCFGSPRAYHIGIVILNKDGSRSVIHAGGGDSSTHGDNPKAYVKVSSLEPGSYYYSRIKTIRRVK